MTSPSARVPKKTRLSVSIIAGAVLVPLSALAAMALMKADAVEASPSEVPAAVAQVQATGVVFADRVASPEDLALACGDAGLELVAAEEEGSISEIQTAALDALREICEAQGMPLPGKPKPDPIIKTIVQQATVQSPSTSEATQQGPPTSEASSSEVHEKEDHGTEEHEEDEEHEEEHHEEHEEGHDGGQGGED